MKFSILGLALTALAQLSMVRIYSNIREFRVRIDIHNLNREYRQLRALTLLSSALPLLKLPTLDTQL